MKINSIALQREKANLNFGISYIKIDNFFKKIWRTNFHVSYQKVSFYRKKQGIQFQTIFLHVFLIWKGTYDVHVREWNEKIKIFIYSTILFAVTHINIPTVVIFVLNEYNSFLKILFWTLGILFTAIKGTSRTLNW